MIISSQRTICQEALQSYISRIANGEMVESLIVRLSHPRFEELGIEAVLVDGHHRMTAMIEMDEEPIFADHPETAEYQAQLDKRGLEGFLRWMKIDSEWYDIEDGEEIEI